jgi:hypothetical protein
MLRCSILVMEILGWRKSVSEIFYFLRRFDGRKSVAERLLQGLWGMHNFVLMCVLLLKHHFLTCQIRSGHQSHERRSFIAKQSIKVKVEEGNQTGRTDIW